MAQPTDDISPLQWFLHNWERELHAAQDPSADLTELLARRVPEYVGQPARPEFEAQALQEATKLTELYLEARRGNEATWIIPTVNDRLDKAFAELRSRGIAARGFAGKSIQDGWGYAGQAARDDDRGAVFYHQEDVVDAIDGLSMPLAFGAFLPAGPEHDAAARLIALETLHALAMYGVAASWSGNVRDRIEVLPFAWRRRRFTTAEPLEPMTSTIVEPEEVIAEPEEPADFDWRRYVVPVMTTHDSRSFDLWLSYTMRGVYKDRAGGRGQMWHSGPPHIFLPAHEHTAFRPGPALQNLPPDEAKVFWNHAMEIVRA